MESSLALSRRTFVNTLVTLLVSFGYLSMYNWANPNILPGPPPNYSPGAHTTSAGASPASNFDQHRDGSAAYGGSQGACGQNSYQQMDFHGNGAQGQSGQTVGAGGFRTPPPPPMGRNRQGNATGLTLDAAVDTILNSIRGIAKSLAPKPPAPTATEC